MSSGKPRPYDDETPSGLVAGLLVGIPAALLLFWVPLLTVGYVIFR